VQLNPLRMRDFYEDGYLVLRGAVARLQVEAARKAVNHSLGYEGLPPDDLPRMRAQSYCASIQKQPVITGLFNDSPLFGLVESMLGEGNLLPVTRGQVALRFPGHGAQTTRRVGGHLDGVGAGINGIPKGEFTRGFCALVTVLLADVREPFCGNFTVYPGSHRTVEDFFKQAGPEVLREGGIVGKLDLPREPVQITGQAGDAVISHHQIIHNAAPNHGPDIRYAAIFRPRHRLTEQIGTAAMTDIWREWDGVRAAVGADHSEKVGAY